MEKILFTILMTTSSFYSFSVAASDEGGVDLSEKVPFLDRSMNDYLDEARTTIEYVQKEFSQSYPALNKAASELFETGTPQQDSATTVKESERYQLLITVANNEFLKIVPQDLGLTSINLDFNSAAFDYKGKAYVTIQRESDGSFSYDIANSYKPETKGKLFNSISDDYKTLNLTGNLNKHTSFTVGDISLVYVKFE